MPAPRYPEDYELPLKPHEIFDRGLDTQLEPESEEEFSPAYHGGNDCHECWNKGDN